jgi:hypothetical protein
MAAAGEFLRAFGKNEQEALKTRHFRHLFRTLLDELVECTRNATTPCLVLLARSETAGLVSLYLQEKAAPFLLLEIDYFSEDQSKEFIGLQVERIARERELPDLVKRYTQHKKPFGEAIDAVFSSIYQAFSVSPVDAWTSPVVRSFLGYAPVLQAVATYISSFKNFQDVQKDVAEGILASTGPSIASTIMQVACPRFMYQAL